jgi:uncharacterized protein with ParB-like and HNH nuclease domain
MSQIQEIRIHLEGIGSSLKSRRFKVPPYQRSYAWEREHVEALLGDVGEAIKNRESEYFLGSIVVTGPIDNRYEVVDGQQRLTTVSLVIAAIKDLFESEGDREAAASIRTDFLTSTDRKTKEKESKLALNEVDNELYQELIENIDGKDAKIYSRQSHKRLIEASRAILEFFNNMCQDSKDIEQDLHAWLDYLEVNLKVIVVSAPDDSNAFVIFETLNDRGLELAISDLLKNYLFHRSGDKLEETKNRWLSMVAVLESATDDPLIVTFLRHVAMSKYGVIREKDLFGALKSKISSKKAALQFSSELRDSARIYTALINTDHEIWAAYDPKVKEAISALNLLGMVQIRPLLLAVLNSFDVAQVKKTFERLESVAVRFQIVGGAGGGTLERIYSDTAKAVSDGKLKNAIDIVKAIKNLPTDAAFEQAFAVAMISKQKLARFYLRKLEEGSSSIDQDERVPNKDASKVNLEHILPITLNETWSKSWSDDDARAYQNRIGNLALLAVKKNSSIGNESYTVKKIEYAASSFRFTKEAAAFTEWSKKSIDDRQIKMAKVAVKVWSII